MLSLHFAALCSGSANFSSMDIFYTASWRAQEDRVDFVLVANVSKQWLAIGFTDKQMMVCICRYSDIHSSIMFIRSLILLLEQLITMELIL